MCRMFRMQISGRRPTDTNKYKLRHIHKNEILQQIVYEKHFMFLLSTRKIKLKRNKNTYYIYAWIVDIEMFVITNVQKRKLLICLWFNRFWMYLWLSISRKVKPKVSFLQSVYRIQTIQYRILEIFFLRRIVLGFFVL